MTSHSISPSQAESSAPPRRYTEAEVAELAERLERDEYTSVFGCLEDWHALKAISFQQPELVVPYVHLLELEVDED
ncbi:DUF2555 domain-containing protein [Synechococcus sp. PCC 7336]|uniref:DUF2555 domain-containing protein n=1 Tax=Synechococcus sp. PCC 7336 TaxID=195250 RepID=UPI0003474FCE|nr:DUF2555 domain-containing protein [Synechococcus sp. PCC 7336]